MRILVTGGSGYIGSRLLAALVDEADVREVVDLDPRPPRVEHAKLRWVQGSVTDDLRGTFAGADVVMHLAWVLDPLHDAARQRAICIGGTERVLEGCAAAGVRHLLYMSSATAYGAHPEHTEPLPESAPLRDQWHMQYSAEKREGEALCARFAAEDGSRLLQMVRPCVVGGPNVSNFIFRSMDCRLSLRPRGLDPWVQVVHEDDVAAALLAIVRSRLPGAFNVAPDEGVPLSRLRQELGLRALPVPLGVLKAIVRAAWRRRLASITEAPPEFLDFVAYPWRVSNRRLREEVGFAFRHTTLDTVKAYRLTH